MLVYFAAAIHMLRQSAAKMCIARVFLFQFSSFLYFFSFLHNR